MAVRIQLHRPYGWSGPDYFLPRCRDLGILCVPILKWEKPRPKTDSEWGEWHWFIEEAVKRYPYQHWWQVWNEPNNLRVPEWTFPDPATYRHFMDDSATYMKIFNPNIKVISGGIACGGHGSKHPATDFNWNWFKQESSVDRVAVHTYCSTMDGAAYAINRARATANQPVWCTELGRKASVDGEEQQGRWFTGVQSRTPTVPKFWFNFKSGEAEASFDSFGALKADWSTRPVWRRLVNAVQS